MAPSYTVRVIPQVPDILDTCTIDDASGCSVQPMAHDEEWKRKIGERIAQLRALKGWSLADLSSRTKGALGKSQISNYEQALRMPGPEEATLLALAFGESAAHILCLDDDMPALSKQEAQLISDVRALPENERLQYMNRIAALATAYKQAVPDERLNQTGYHPGKRPGPTLAPTPIKRRSGSSDD